MKNFKRKKIILDILYQFAGSLLISYATINIASGADIALSGFNGIGLILNKLFGFSIGLSVFLMNVPFALFCWKFIGKNFLAKSIGCLAFQSVLMDYVMPFFPTLSMDRMVSTIAIGVFFGIGYALIYVRKSSTGGIDFIVMLMKRWKSHISTGKISLIVEIITIAAYGIIFNDIEAVVYGILVSFISTTVIDKFIFGLNSGSIAYIVTEKGNGPDICAQIDNVCQRGSTILEGKGGFTGEPKDVVMVTGSVKDIYGIQQFLEKAEPDAFVIIMNSKEVQGNGFSITKVAGDK